MKKFIAILLVIVMIAALCACGKSNTAQPAAAEPTAETAPEAAAETTEAANEAAQKAVADEQNKAGALVGKVSHLSTGMSLVVEASGNVYCFDIPTDTDTKNMVADNNVTVYFSGNLDPTVGTSFQPVTIEKIEFADMPQIVMVGGTPAPADTVAAPTVAPTADPAAQIATQTAEGNAIMYMWSDGSMHDTPEDGQSYVTAAQVATINFEEPNFNGPYNACNGTIFGFVENNKYMILDDGAGHQYLFYIEGKPNKSYDGTGLVVGANCTVMYVGTLNPNYGATTPQYVYVDNIQTDSKAFYYSVIAPKATTKPTPGPNGMWYGTDGKLHWYGKDGKIYNYDKNGNIVLS